MVVVKFLIVYVFSNAVLYSEGMGQIKNHRDILKHDENSSEVRKLNEFDPAPLTVKVKRKRKGTETTVEPIDEESASTAEFGSHARSERTKLYRRTKTLPVGTKRNSGIFTLQRPSLHKESQQEALSLSVLQNLVAAIHNNNHMKVGDIVRDMQQKLEIVKNLAEGKPDPLRNLEAYQKYTKPYQLVITEKPRSRKPKNIIKEMDKIMSEFFRRGNDVKNFSGSSEIDDEDRQDQPYLRSVDRPGQEEDEDLLYDLDGGGRDLKLWMEI